MHNKHLYWKKRVLYVCLLCIGLTACISEDETAPVIEEGTFEILLFDEVTETFSNTLGENETIDVPGSFVIVGNFRDNVLIERMELNIFPQVDFVEDPTKRISIFPWDASGDNAIELPVQGNAVNVFREVALPTSALSGEYILDLVVFDSEGNASETYNQTFAISNQSPLITLTQPIIDSETYLVGDTLEVLGQVEATNNLKSISLRLGAGDNFSTITFEEADFNGNIFEINSSFEITEDLGIGDRFLRVIAIDELDKSSSIELLVEIDGI